MLNLLYFLYILRLNNLIYFIKYDIILAAYAELGIKLSNYLY